MLHETKKGWSFFMVWRIWSCRGKRKGKKRENVTGFGINWGIRETDFGGFCSDCCVDKSDIGREDL